MKNVLNAIVGVGGAIVSYGFGGWSDLFGFFLLIIAVDYLSGVAASLKEGTGLSSKTGFIGLLRKGLMLLVIIVAHRADMLFGSNLIMTGAIYFYVANELISVTENYGRMGLPLPDQVKQIINALKQRGGGQ